VVLGMVPLARELLHRGTNVVLTANSTPALNDITHAELVTPLSRSSQAIQP
jgi:type II pantothenate kinase